jgi:hypothetical protein
MVTPEGGEVDKAHGVFWEAEVRLQPAREGPHVSPEGQEPEPEIQHRARYQRTNENWAKPHAHLGPRKNQTKQLASHEGEPSASHIPSQTEHSSETHTNATAKQTERPSENPTKRLARQRAERSENQTAIDTERASENQTARLANQQAMPSETRTTDTQTHRCSTKSLDERARERLAAPRGSYRGRRQTKTI